MADQTPLTSDIFWRTVRALPEFYGQNWLSLGLLVLAAIAAWRVSRRRKKDDLKTGVREFAKNEIAPILVGGVVFFVGAVAITVVQAVTDRDADQQRMIRNLGGDGPVTKREQDLRDALAKKQAEALSLQLSNQMLRDIINMTARRAESSNDLATRRLTPQECEALLLRANNLKEGTEVVITQSFSDFSVKSLEASRDALGLWVRDHVGSPSYERFRSATPVPDSVPGTRPSVEHEKLWQTAKAQLKLVAGMTDTLCK